jgi:hypothetical protein
MYRASAKSSTDLAADHTGVFQGLWDVYVGELLGFFSRLKVRICRMAVSIDLAEVMCSGRLHRRTPLGASCLEIDESDEIRSDVPVFLSNHLVSEGAL